MKRVNAGEWKNQPWNSTAGRLQWWAARWHSTRTVEARFGFTLFYLSAVRQLGEVAARAAVGRAGLALPVWLAQRAAEAPAGAAGVARAA